MHAMMLINQWYTQVSPDTSKVHINISLLFSL